MRTPLQNDFVTFEGSQYGPDIATSYAIGEELPSSFSLECTFPTHHPSCFCRLPLLLVRFPTMRDPLQNLLPILIRLDLRDLDLAGSNTDWDALAVALLAGDALDVDDVFEAVDGDDLALAALVGAALDDHFVVFAEGQGADLEVRCK